MIGALWPTTARAQDSALGTDNFLLDVCVEAIAGVSSAGLGYCVGFVTGVTEVTFLSDTPAYR